MINILSILMIFYVIDEKTHYHIVFKGQKNVQVGSGSVINWPPGFEFRIQGSRRFEFINYVVFNFSY
jgi:hypothetical protein